MTTSGALALAEPVVAVVAVRPRAPSGVWEEHPWLVPRLKELAPQGLSASLIARILNNEAHEKGVTLKLNRNAVIGKLYRLGLGMGGVPIKERAVRSRIRTKPKAARIVERVLSHGSRLEKVRAIEIEQDNATEDDYAIPVKQRKTLVQLESCHCHWPVGDPQDKNFFFCGGVKVEGLPYCKAHCRKAYYGAPKIKPIEAKRRQIAWA